MTAGIIDQVLHKMGIDQSNQAGTPLNLTIRAAAFMPATGMVSFWVASG
jgi:hypothetical protein